jgi:hypothetical protein
MKTLLFYTLLLLGVYAKAQTPITSYQVASIAAMKSYFGSANRIYVVANGQEYIVCSVCTADEVSVYAGAGGRKWQRMTIGYSFSGLTAGNHVEYDGTNFTNVPGLSLTTTGSSGAATFNTTTKVLNIPQYSGGTTSATANQIVYGTGTGVTSSTNFQVDNTNAYLGVGKTPVNPIDVLAATNASKTVTIQNTSTGTAGQAGFTAKNSSGTVGFGITGTGYTAYGVLGANTANIYSDRGIVLMSDVSGGYIIFAPGSNTEAARFTSGKELLIGSTSDLGTYPLQVTGNTITTGSFTSGAPATGTAAPWKLGSAVTTTGLTLSTTQYIQVDINGTLYKLAIVQ